MLRSLLSLVAPPLCWSCWAPAPEPEPLCQRCRRALRWLEEGAGAGGVVLWAPVAYEGPARELVRAFKFKGATGIADFMSAQIAARAPEAMLEGAVLVPVPLHPVRLRRRGFNQAERLASALARRAGLTLASCLERHGSAAPQVGRGRSERATALYGRVALRTGASPPGKVLLVDDVATTGATLAACAAALRAGGTHEISAVAYARTPAR